MLTHRSMLRRTASAYASRTALVADTTTLTYGELDAVTTAMAEALLSSGLRPGERIVWLNSNCLEYLIAYFATAKAGLLLAPLNYWLRPGELEQLVDFVDPVALMVGPDYREVVDSFASTSARRLRVAVGGRTPPGWVSWSDLLDRSGQASLPAEDENALHELIFTSGTTGQAKGVLRTQRQRILDSVMAALVYQLNRNDHMVFFGPQFHIGGASVPNQVLVQGGTASVMTFDPERACDTIARGATYLIGVPAHYNLMFETGRLRNVDTSRVRGAYVGGSVATRRLFGLIQEHFPGADLVHGYGSTESGPHSMALRGQDFLDHYGSLGLPVPGSEVKVTDSAGNEVARGDVGELVVRSESVMHGYFKRPDLTALVLDEDGWLRTGDLVRQDDDGYFQLAGRAKELIISGGENVYPKEVEDTLATHESVAEVAVIGVPDDIYEERVVALVRLGPGAAPVTERDLIAYVRERLAGFKTPKELHFVDDFPRTPLGKIAKEELKQSYGSVFGDR